MRVVQSFRAQAEAQGQGTASVDRGRRGRNRLHDRARMRGAPRRADARREALCACACAMPPRSISISSAPPAPASGRSSRRCPALGSSRGAAERLCSAPQGRARGASAERTAAENELQFAPRAARLLRTRRHASRGAAVSATAAQADTQPAKRRKPPSKESEESACQSARSPDGRRCSRAYSRITLSDAGLSMMTVLPRTPYHSATTVCAFRVSGTPTTNVVGMRLKLAGA